MSSIDYWDGAANRHYLTFAMAHGPELRRLYGQDQMRVIADVLLRHKNIWARECRCLEREGHKPDDLGKSLWAAEMQRGLESIHARFVICQDYRQAGLDVRDFGAVGDSDGVVP